MSVLKDCKPTDVFGHFEKICSIPHGSWDEKALSDYILGWAKGLGLEACQDELFNLIIKKPASEGFEASPAVILQAHIDMVCEKNADVVFDFKTEGLNLFIEGDILKARGTTLGADNGIGVAMSMAILADKTLAHPPLEVVFTTLEEVGLNGAKGLDTSGLVGTRFINLDSSEEGIFFAGCAGGAKVTISLPIELETPKADEDALYTIFVSGLKGGHSGADIHFERGNSNKILGRVLSCLDTSFRLVEISGGAKDNAIPREAVAKIVAKKGAADALRLEIEHLSAAIKAEFATSDADLTVVLAQEGDATSDVKFFLTKLNKKL